MPPLTRQEERPSLRLPIPEPMYREDEEEKTESSRIIVIDMVDPD